MGKSTATTNPLVNVGQPVISAQQKPKHSEGRFRGLRGKKGLRKDLERKGGQLCRQAQQVGKVWEKASRCLFKSLPSRSVG